MAAPIALARHLRHGLATAALLAAAGIGLEAADSSAIPVASMGEGKGSAADTSTGHSWELPPIAVHGGAASDTRDDELVGTYGQPRWSTTRRFTEVRTYVIPEGQFDFEYWMFVSTPSRNAIDQAKDAGESRPKAEIKQQFEAELGIGHRLQLDIYQVYAKDGSNGVNELDETKFEVRYALGDWDKIWGNPTLYAEWIQAANGADSGEYKLLLCDDFNSRWMWATNFVFQEMLGDTRDRSHEWNSAIAYDAIDTKLSIGAESNIAYVSNLETPSSDTREHHWEVGVGPSIRWYPTAHAHVILAEFIGLTNDTSQSKTVGIVGWEF